MIISITGHTSGIGLSLFNHFQNAGHTCIGFSRSNGYDISIPANRTRILSSSINADVFINNAYNNWDDSQFLLLQGMAKLWSGKDKLIINSASVITDYPRPDNDPLEKYVQTKKLLDTFSTNHRKLPCICNLKLGFVDTPRVSKFTEEKLSLENIIKTVDFVVQNKGILNLKSISLVKNQAGKDNETKMG
jgi:NAD(P)-dependent dehydrogenase (short-subunit alcohol dehydrogenase family)